MTRSTTANSTQAIALGSTDFRLISGSRCGQCQLHPWTGSRDAIGRWLRQFMGAPLVLQELRRVAIRHDVQMAGRAQHDVIERVARLLEIRQYHICRRSAASGQGQGSSPEPSTHVPFPLSNRKRIEPADREARPEAPVLRPGLDPEVQRLSLEEAARMGGAFCEECEKLAAAAAATPAPQPEEPPMMAYVDASPMVKTLKMAALNGNAFCEECARLA